jgi:hypothetical protein
MATSRVEQFVRNFAQNEMKLLLENAGNVQDMLALAQADVLDLIDFARMKPAGTSFVARDYRNIEADIVLTAPLRKSGRRSRQEVLVYILIEHQSEPDELMAFRVLEYVVQIYRAQIREQSQGRSSLRGIRLRPVLPVVFYTGTRTWQSVGTIGELVESGERFARWTPSLEPLFLNVSTLEAEALEAEGGAFGQVLRLVRGRRAPLADFRALLEGVVGRLAPLAEGERVRWQDLLSYILAFVYHERQPPERSELQDLVEASVQTDDPRREVKAMRQTIAEALKAEGKKEGKLEAHRTILMDQLRQRFGEVPPEVEVVVERTANLKQLKEWLGRVLSANDLAGIGIAPQS